MRIKRIIAVAFATLLTLALSAPAQAQFGLLKKGAKALGEAAKKGADAIPGVEVRDDNSVQSDINAVSQAVDSNDEDSDSAEFKQFDRDRYHHKTAKGRNMRLIDDSAKLKSDLPGMASDSLPCDTSTVLSQAEQYLQQKGLKIVKYDDQPDRIYTMLMERRNKDGQQEGRRVMIAASSNGSRTQVKVAALQMERRKARASIGEAYKPGDIRIDQTESRKVLDQIKSMVSAAPSLSAKK